MIYSVGHSTRSAEEFLELLSHFKIDLLVDVRRYASSRRHPHFAQGPLQAALARIGIGYLHEPNLGGWRRPRKDSPNSGWQTAGFRGYADYTETEAFRAALQRLIAAAKERTVTIMCAEAVPWRCHRQLIADQLWVRGCPVTHIIGPGRSEAHRLHPMARVLPGPKLVYPAIQLPLRELP